MNMLGLRDLFLIAQTPSLHNHHHHNQNQPISTDNNNSNLPLPSSAASLSVGFGIFPLLTATPCIPQPQNQTNDVQESSAPNNNNNYWNLRMCPEVNNNTSPKKGEMNFDNDDENNNKVVVMSESEENGIYGADYRVCQDCGNRAKKDCVYRRCRTCCKGRGYHCTTHVKSTWTPSVRRREREVAVLSGGGGGDGGVKRPRSSQNVTTSHSSNSNGSTTKNFATSSCHQDAGFKESLPGHVKAPAVFRCHRVSAIGNCEDEFAYLATVHISGHVFKGFLYDHGVGDKNAMPCVSELQLGNNNYSERKNGECSSAFGISNAYPASAS